MSQRPEDPEFAPVIGVMFVLFLGFAFFGQWGIEWLVRGGWWILLGLWAVGTAVCFGFYMLCAFYELMQQLGVFPGQATAPAPPFKLRLIK